MREAVSGLTLHVTTTAPRWVRPIGLRIEVELFSKRRHDLRFRLAAVRLPLGTQRREIDIDPDSIAAVTACIGGRFSPVYRRSIHLVEVPERSSSTSELLLTADPEWALFGLDPGDVTTTVSWVDRPGS